MSRVSEGIAEGVKLLTAAVAFASKPDMQTGLKSALTLHEIIGKVAKEPPKRVAGLAIELTTAAQVVFDGLARDLPDDAATLYAQMVRATLPSAADLIAAQMNAETACEHMLDRLTDPDHRDQNLRTLFTAITAPTLRRLLADRAFAEDLTPDFMAAVLRDLTDTGLILRRLEATHGSLANALDVLSTARRDELEAIATRFEVDRVFGRTDRELRTFLDAKAEEYRAYRAQIDRIDTRTAGLGNLKAAAKDAAERLDFDEVEHLLSRVDQVETEIAAETKELRAANALLQGRVEDAYRHFNAAADSFAGIDPAEPGRRRVRYAEPLYNHGVRYGGAGLAMAIDMGQVAAARLKSADNPVEWASAMQNLANALQTHGIRTEGAAGADLLAQAVTAYGAALTVSTRADHPMQWAATTQNFALALQTQGTRTAGEASTDLLALAVATYREALTVITRADHPVQWATTMQNLAGALQTQGTRTAGEAGTDLLAQAVAAYEQALTVTTRADHPVQWAMTMQNLASALATQGTRTEGAAGTALLAQAVAACEQALTVRTRADHPVEWARTTQNLALALQTQGTRTEGAAGADLLARAVAACEAALTVSTRADHPVDWAMTMQNLAVALRNQGNRTEGAAGADLLARAVTTYEQALTVRTRADHPVQWAMTKQNLAGALSNQGTRTEGAAGTDLLARAVAAFEAVLTVFTRADHPVQWATTQQNMANCEGSWAAHPCCAAPLPHLRAAIAHVDAALTVFDPVHLPYNHTKATTLRAQILAALAPHPPGSNRDASP